MCVRKVLVAGWTAAGKTTHARLLARNLGWPYAGMSTIMHRFVRHGQYGQYHDSEWTKTDDIIRLHNPDLDVHADRAMTDLIAANDHLVVDSWLQPWLYSGKDAIRVWLGSSFPARVMKATVTYLRRGQVPPSDCAAEVSGKDRFAATQFDELYRIQYCPDRGLFDIVLDNTGFIARPDVAESDSGIMAFHPDFEKAIRDRL